MTIRIVLLSVLALFCFAATGFVSPSPALAADTGTAWSDARGPDAGSVDERRRALKEELMKLPPAQRRARIEEMKQQTAADRAKKMQQRKDEFQGRWDKASPEERSKFCGKVQRKCADDGKKFACEIARNKCAAGH